MLTEQEMWDTADQLQSPEPKTKCDLCLEQAEELIPAEIMIGRMVFNKYIQVQVSGMICDGCNSEENKENGFII